TCSSEVTAPAAHLVEVHSSLVTGYPSTVVIYNAGASAASAVLTVADADTASQLFTYATPSIPANGQQILLVSDMEKAASFSPTSGTNHYVVSVNGEFTGYLQHLVNNQQTNSFVDMTTVCGLGSISSSAPSSGLDVGGVFSSSQTQKEGSQSF